MLVNPPVDSRITAWSSTPCSSSNPPPASQTWMSRLGDWLSEARSHRVICLILGIWLLNSFDLIFTVLAYQHGLLHEENPVARHMLQYGTPSVVLFKIGLVLIGSYPLLRFRRTRVAELGAITILMAYAMLSFHWSICFEQYTITVSQSVNFASLNAAP